MIIDSQKNKMSKEDNHINHSETPNLFELKNKQAFSVPKNYFSELETSIKKQISNGERVEGLSKSTSFEVPKGYFDALESRINKPNKGKLIKMFSFKTVGYAASLLAIVSFSLWFYTSNKSANQELLAFNKQYNNLTAESYFDELTDLDLTLTTIEFNELDLTEDDELSNVFLEEEEVTIDPVELINFDDSYDLFY